MKTHLIYGLLLHQCIYCHNKGKLVEPKYRTNRESLPKYNIIYVFIHFFFILAFCRALSNSIKEQRCCDAALVAGHR